jgi:CBS domain-containing protein
MERVLVSNIMSTPVEKIALSATATKAATLMRDSDISCLVVLEGDGVAGIVTTTDLRDLVAAGTPPEDATVQDMMTATVETVGPGTTVREAARVMANVGIKHLPVTETGELVGLVSSTDVVNFVPGYGDEVR